MEVGVTSIDARVTDSTQQVVLPLSNLVFYGKKLCPLQILANILVLFQKISLNVGRRIGQVDRSAPKGLNKFRLIYKHSLVPVIVA
jgi:hypothetical protein